MDSQTPVQNVTSVNEGLNVPSEVRNFLESLLQDAGMTALDTEMKEEMLKELYTRLDNFLTSTIIDNLPAEQLDTFIRMNEEKRSKTEIEQFLQEKLPNVSEIFSRAFMEFRDLYLGNVTVARNAPEPTNQGAMTEVGTIPTAVKPAQA